MLKLVYTEVSVNHQGDSLLAVFYFGIPNEFFFLLKLIAVVFYICILLGIGSSWIFIRAEAYFCL